MKLIQNIYYRLSSSLIIALLGFATSVIVIRIFGVEIVGMISYYMSIFGMISCLCDLGLSSALTKFISEKKFHENDLISAYFALKIVLLILFIVLSLIVIQNSNEHFDHKLLSIIFFTILLGNSLRSPLISICIAKRYFKIVSNAEVFSNIITSVYTIVICIFFQNIYLLAIKMFLLYFFEIIFIFFYMDRKSTFNFVFPDIQLIKKFITFAFPLALTAFVSKIMSHTDSLIIGYLIGMKELGFYEIAKRLFAPFEMIIKPVTTTLYPEILRKMVSNKKFFYNDFKELVHLLTCIGAFLTLFIIFLSEPFVKILYGPENLRAATIFVFFSGICITKLFFNPYHHLVLGLEFQYIYPYITIISSIIRVTGYLLIIPQIVNNCQVGAIAIPLVNTFTCFFPDGLVIWYKIRSQYNKTHILETIVKICTPLIFILFVGYYFHYNLWLFPFAIVLFIIIQIQLKIITKSKMEYIFQPFIQFLSNNFFILG